MSEVKLGSTDLASKMHNTILCTLFRNSRMAILYVVISSKTVSLFFSFFLHSRAQFPLAFKLYS